MCHDGVTYLDSIFDDDVSVSTSVVSPTSIASLLQYLNMV